MTHFSWPMLINLQMAISALEFCRDRVESGQKINETYLLSAQAQIGQVLEENRRREQVIAWERQTILKGGADE